VYQVIKDWRRGKNEHAGPIGGKNVESWQRGRRGRGHSKRRAVSGGIYKGEGAKNLRVTRKVLRVVSRDEEGETKTKDGYAFAKGGKAKKKARTNLVHLGK